MFNVNKQFVELIIEKKKSKFLLQICTPVDIGIWFPETDSILYTYCWSSVWPTFPVNILVTSLFRWLFLKACLPIFEIAIARGGSGALLPTIVFMLQIDVRKLNKNEKRGVVVERSAPNKTCCIRRTNFSGDSVKGTNGEVEKIRGKINNNTNSTRVPGGVLLLFGNPLLLLSRYY